MKLLPRVVAGVGVTGFFFFFPFLLQFVLVIMFLITKFADL